MSKTFFKNHEGTKLTKSANQCLSLSYKIVNSHLKVKKNKLVLLKKTLITLHGSAKCVAGQDG